MDRSLEISCNDKICTQFGSEENKTDSSNLFPSVAFTITDLINHFRLIFFQSKLSLNITQSILLDENIII
jgi:hypothetical protein